MELAVVGFPKVTALTTPYLPLAIPVFDCFLLTCLPKVTCQRPTTQG